MGRVLVITSENSGYDSDTEQTTKSKWSEKKQNILDLSTLIRERLIQYSEEGSYPLCEFLDYHNIHNYVTWILS